MIKRILIVNINLMDSSKKLNEIWNLAKNQLLETIPEADRVWINELEYNEEKDNVLTLSLPSSFHLLNYTSYCQETVSNLIDELA